MIIYLFFDFIKFYYLINTLTMWLKHSLSNANNTESVFAIIVAALGALYNKANSPKLSPGWYTFKCFGYSPNFITY